MKNILLIGVGGTGSNAVDIFYQKKEELGNQSGNNITALVFDTDAGDLKRITAAKKVVMADNASVGTICDRFGREYLKEWFPCDDKAVRAQEMVRGASQWRKKSYLAFLNLMNKPLARSTFISALEQMTVDPGASCEIYIIASVAGGTGSGSFIPIALYAKRYLRKTLGKDPIINAMIALPDIYADSQTPENRVKVFSNAYAILRELNAINLVARNYNAGVAEHKKAPIRFRIGDAREPSVGLLFDASDRQFWTPEAAPFSQVFLLDRIPGLNSVTAHDMVLANSLYTILCTDIGSAFDSEFSNHELLRSQNNGSNAIYAGISTSQLRFPRETVLDYLAHKKTLNACDTEWLTLHKAVENAIREKEQQAKAMNRRYDMRDDEYASIVLEELDKLVENNNEELLSITERAVDTYDEDGNKEDVGPAELFAKKIDKYINSCIPNKAPVETELGRILDDALPQKGKMDPDAVPETAQEMYKKIFEYYKECIDKIKRTAKSTADSIITLDKKKGDYINANYSITDNLLKKNGKYIHPVASMIQLCKLRVQLAKMLPDPKKASKTEEWEDLKKRSVDEISDPLMTVSPASVVGKSAYLAWGDSRFKTISGSAGDEYLDEKSNAIADAKYVLEDAKEVLGKVYRGAQGQFKLKVYTAIARDIDLLIAKYRNFFKRFEKEKEELVEATKTVYRKDSGAVDSVINVFSTEADKDTIYKRIIEDGGPATTSEVTETDHLVGQSVFETVYNSAASAYAQDKSWNDKDSGAYRSLFDGMVKAYRGSIARNEDFEQISAYNVIEAIAASCGDGNTGSVSDEFKARFSIAQELATPSLRLDTTTGTMDIVRPSNIMVFMMSVNTARYLKKHADEFGLHLPADQSKEDKVLKACAEEFIQRYSGNNSARVSIVSSMPDQVLYCTGEIMDITPLRIAKFNELGEDNVYFKNYSIAIANFKKYGTDMWNPHLGNDLHKRGYLPYMNEEKEKECDVMVVKALLYGFQKQYIVYKNSVGDNKFFFSYNNQKITDSEGRWINNKNTAQLIAWLRNEDELVAEWSSAFDRDVQRQLNLLPSLASDSGFAALEAALTKSEFMLLLNDKLYTDPSFKGGDSTKKVKLEGGKLEIVDRDGPTAFEFVYMIKTSEELGRDCDDAERVLTVLYDTFMKFCAYRTNPESTPERFIQVYKQQLGKFFESVAATKLVQSAKDKESARALLSQYIIWLNQAGVFNSISDDTPVDEKGNLCINIPFDIAKSPDVKKIIENVKKEPKKDAE